MKRSRGRGVALHLALGLILTLLASCKFESAAIPATTLVLDVDAEPLIRSRLSELRIAVASARHRDNLDERESVFEQVLEPGAGDPEARVWPVRLVLTPKEGDTRRVFEVTATALNADQALVAQARLITGYVTHQIRYARLVLEAECFGVECDDLQTCRVGGCTGAFVEPADLPLLPGPDAGMSDAGPSDAGPPELDGGPDAGPDASPDSGPPPIDPCLKDNGGCDLLVECIQVDGVPTCGRCPAGFVDVNGNGSRCEDVDECTENKGGCDPAHGLCMNTPGSHDCKCEAGYHGNGRQCTVNVPCSDDPAVCDSLATCQEFEGRRVCQCNLGYEGDGGQCTDIDECARNLDTCTAHSACTNTPGSFSCACDRGYVMLGQACTDIDECLTNDHDCDRMPNACRNIDGAFLCMCPPGYEGLGVGDTCLDIDECTRNTDGCATTTPDACLNTVGSYMCDCPAGYLGSGVGPNGCLEVNECVLNLDGCYDDPNSCINDLGGIPGYHCVCPPGFSGDGVGPTGCVDINQCTSGSNTCDTAPVACVNVTGLPGFMCMCPAGYSGDGIGGNGCVDIDECVLNTDLCDDDPNACVNDVGGSPGYHCDCPAGWGGTGMGSAGCSDVDQCAMNLDNCDDAPNACLNDVGGMPGFRCECPSGYSGNGTGPNGCNSINECSSPTTHTCDTDPLACVDEEPVNGSPGYRCACPVGYTGLGVGAGGCSDINECTSMMAPDDCNANADCNGATPPGGFTCTCRAGFTGDGHGPTGCTDVNSCLPGSCENGGTCVDNPAGAPTPFTCNCACGWSGATCATEASTTVGPTGLAGNSMPFTGQDVIAAVPIVVGAATSLAGFKVGSPTGAVRVRMGLYTDSANSPGNKVAESAVAMLSSARVPLLGNPMSCLALAAGTYWIVIQGEGAFGVGAGPGPVTRYSQPLSFASGLPATFIPSADSGTDTLALQLVTAP